MDDLEIPGYAPKVAAFHRNGGNFGPEWVATFKRNGGSFAPEYALVRFDPSRKSFDSFMEVRFLIQEIFPDVEIDLVLEDAIKPVIRDKILSEALDVA